MSEPILKNEAASILPGSITYVSYWKPRQRKIAVAVWLWLVATLAACAPMTPDQQERLARMQMWAAYASQPTPVYYPPPLPTVRPAPGPMIHATWPGQVPVR